MIQTLSCTNYSEMLIKKAALSREDNSSVLEFIIITFLSLVVKTDSHQHRGTERSVQLAEFPHRLKLKNSLKNRRVQRGRGCVGGGSLQGEALIRNKSRSAECGEFFLP